MDVDKAILCALERASLSQLKPDQEKAIKTFVSGKVVFVSLPTGFGKSLCFALLPLVFDFLLYGGAKSTSIVVCVSPLTALMMDQRSKFTHRGISCEFIGQLQQDVTAMKAVREGKCQLVYISPESLLRNPQWRDMLQSTVYQSHLVGLIIDEAHCIVQW